MKKIMAVLFVLCVIGISGCCGNQNPADKPAKPNIVFEGRTDFSNVNPFYRFHDLDRGATCWMASGGALSSGGALFCIPDSQLKPATLPAESPATGSP